VGHYKNRPDDFPEAVLIGDSFNIAYLTSDTPLGFASRETSVFHGVVLPNPGFMFQMPYNNNHHKIFEFKGKYYITYHTKLLQDVMGINLNFNYRSTSIDAVNLNPDGTFEVVNGTRTGVPQIGYFNPYKITDAATMNVMAGISTAEYVDMDRVRRMKVTNISSGDWIALRGVDFGTAGAKKLYCRINPLTSSSGVIQIKQGGLDGTPIGYVVVKPGQGSYTINLLKIVTGIDDLVFIFYGSGYDFEEWQFFAN
jgi:arabinoxylan arabinofuranohydrolase